MMLSTRVLGRRARAYRAALVVGALLFADQAAAADKWKWTVIPYLWLTDLGIDVSINDRQVVDRTIDIKDLAEDITLTLQVRAEAQHGKHGVLVDAFYVELTDDPKTIALPTPPAGTATLDTEIDMTILEAAGLFDPKGDREGFELLYGTRVIDQRADIDVQFTPGVGPPASRTFEPSDTVYDGMLGVRWIRHFGHGWVTALRGDVAAGGTKFTWNVNTTLGYSFGKDGRFAVLGGYRKMDVEFKEEDSVESEMTLSGPLLGFRFLF
jgi:hypothetical protein